MKSLGYWRAVVVVLMGRNGLKKISGLRTEDVGVS